MVLTIGFEKFLENIDAIKQGAFPVRILYKPTDVMTVDQFIAIQGAKLKMDFVPMPDMKDDALSSGYLLGRLTAETASTILVTDTEALLNIGSIPAKGNGVVYFAKDIKQAQKLEKSSSTTTRKRAAKKETAPAEEKKTAAAGEKKEKTADFDGFMNLPEENFEDKKEGRIAKVETYLKKALGTEFADKYYDAITQSVKKADEYVGWEVLLRIAAMNKEDSAKIYEKLSPKFSELKAML